MVVPRPMVRFPGSILQAALRTWEVANRLGLAMVLMFVPAQAHAFALHGDSRVGENAFALRHCRWIISVGPAPSPAQLLPPSLVQLREHRNVYSTS